MTQTFDRPDTDIAELVDFVPKCIIKLKRIGSEPIECENTAVWVGFLPCCGNSGLVCEEHFGMRHTRPFVCGPCQKVHNDLIGWQRL